MVPLLLHVTDTAPRVHGTLFGTAGFLFITLTFAVQLPFVNMGLILGDSWLLIREAAENMYSASACYAARLVINTSGSACLGIRGRVGLPLSSATLVGTGVNRRAAK